MKYLAPVPQRITLRTRAPVSVTENNVAKRSTPAGGCNSSGQMSVRVIQFAAYSFVVFYGKGRTVIATTCSTRVTRFGAVFRLAYSPSGQLLILLCPTISGIPAL